MRPISARARNFVGYETLDFTYPADVCALVGENGAGKSSLARLVDVALFCGDARELAAWLRRGEDELMVELTFDHADETYRVRRSYRDGKSAKLDLEIRCDHKTEPVYIWEPLTRESTAATQQAIVELLGFGRETFRASAYYAQGDGSAFTNSGPSEKKRRLVEVSGVEEWAPVNARIRRDLAAAEKELATLNGRLADREELVATRAVAEQAVAAANTDVARAELAVAAAESEHTAALAAERALDADRLLLAEAEAAEAAANTTLQRLGADHARAEQAARDADTTAATVAELTPVAAGLNAIGMEFRQIDTARFARRDAIRDRDAAAAAVSERERALALRIDERDRLRQAASDADRKADHIAADPHDQRCDRCRQTLDTEAAYNAVVSLRGDAVRDLEAADELDAVIASEREAILADRAHIDVLVIPPEPDAGDLEQRLAAARAASTRLAVEQANHERHLADAAAWTVEHTAALMDARDNAERATTATLSARAKVPADLDAIGERTHYAALAVTDRRHVLDTAKHDHAAVRSRLDRIVETQAAIAGDLEHRDTLHEHVDTLTDADRITGLNGIPAWILEAKTIPYMETEANRILHELGGDTATYQIELRTQRALKTDDTRAKETLDIILHTPTGETNFDPNLSGGERTRVDIALRLALAELLATTTGVEILVIDEPDGLDTDGMERLAGILRGLLHRFQTILVVSHNPVLATQFETVIEVVSVDGVSRIVDRQAVTA